MGRPVKVKNPVQIKLAGERLKFYRASHKITQEALSEMLDIDTSSVKRYEKGKDYLISQKAARRLARRTNTSALYWLGYPAEDVEFDELFGDEFDSWQPDSDFEEKTATIRATAARYNTFFAVFDVNHPYRYQNIEDTAEYDFDGVPDPDGHTVQKYNGPHLITSAADSSIRVSVAEVPTTPAGWYGLITSIGQKHSA